MTTTIIAEAGVNHNGDLELAKKLIQVAAKSGANFVKFQTFKAGLLATKNANKANYQIQNSQVAESQYEMLKNLELSEGIHRELIKEADRRGIGAGRGRADQDPCAEPVAPAGRWQGDRRAATGYTTGTGPAPRAQGQCRTL